MQSWLAATPTGGWSTSRATTTLSRSTGPAVARQAAHGREPRSAAARARLDETEGLAEGRSLSGQGTRRRGGLVRRRCREAPPRVCKKFEGPWAEGIDPEAAALTRHQRLKVRRRRPARGGRRATGHGAPDEAGRVWSWPTARSCSTCRWSTGHATPGGAGGRLGRRRAGSGRLRRGSRSPANPEQDRPPSIFALLGIAAVRLDRGADLVAFGLAACLAGAARLGRPRPEPPSGATGPSPTPRPWATCWPAPGEAEAARALRDSYRRWRRAGPPVRGAACNGGADTGRAPARPRRPSARMTSRLSCARPRIRVDEPLAATRQVRARPHALTIPTPEPVLTIRESEPCPSPPGPAVQTADVGGARADRPGPAPDAGDRPVADWARPVMAEVNKVFVGQDELVRGVLARAPGRGPRPDRERARAWARRCWCGPRPGARAAPSTGSSSRPT